jgi:hypothetical protein
MAAMLVVSGVSFIISYPLPRMGKRFLTILLFTDQGRWHLAPHSIIQYRKFIKGGDINSN